MNDYVKSRQHEFWQGVFFLLLMAFMFVVTPLLYGQDPVSRKVINGVMVERFPFPIFQQQVWGTNPGDYLIIGPDGYIAGSNGGTPGGGLSTFQGRATPSAVLLGTDVSAALAVSPFFITTTGCNNASGTFGGVIYSDPGNNGQIHCSPGWALDGGLLDGFSNLLGTGIKNIELNSITGNGVFKGFVDAIGLDAGHQTVTSVHDGISSDDAATVNQLNGLSAFYAPLNNPTNGQNNYAPLANPSTTGVDTSAGGFNAGSSKVTNVANGTAANDGVNFSQIGQKISTESSPLGVAANNLSAPNCAEGTSHTNGWVPDPGGTPGTTKFLREDCTWVAPSGSSAAPQYILFAPGPQTSLVASTTYYIGPTTITSTVGNRASYYVTAQRTATLKGAELVLDTGGSGLFATGCTFSVFDITSGTTLMTSSPFTSNSALPTTFTYNGLTGTVTAGDQLQVVLVMPAGSSTRATWVRATLYLE